MIQNVPFNVKNRYQWQCGSWRLDGCNTGNTDTPVTRPVVCYDNLVKKM